MAYNGSLGVANNQPDGQAGGRCGCPFFLLNCFLSKPQNITSVVGEFCRPLLNSEKNSECPYSIDVVVLVMSLFSANLKSKLYVLVRVFEAEQLSDLMLV